MSSQKLETKYYYFLGTINNGSINDSEPIGVFKGRGSWESNRFWIHTVYGGRRDYFHYFDTFEEASKAYTKNAKYIIKTYENRIEEFKQSKGYFNE